MTLTSFVFIKLANTMNYGGGVSPSCHSKQFPVISLRSTEYHAATDYVLCCQIMIGNWELNDYDLNDYDYI